MATMKINGRTFEKTADRWFCKISNSKHIIVIPDGDARTGRSWIAKIRKTSKKGNWMEGTKTIEDLAESRGKTIKAAVEALPEISEMTPQVKASIKYNEKNVKQVKLALNKSTDADIIKALENCDNVQGYIKELIRKDLAK